QHHVQAGGRAEELSAGRWEPAPSFDGGKGCVSEGPEENAKTGSAYKRWARLTRKQAPTGERESAKGRKREPEQERGRSDVAAVVPQIGSAFAFSLFRAFAFSVGRSVGSQKGGGPPLRERGPSPFSLSIPPNRSRLVLHQSAVPLYRRE